MIDTKNVGDLFQILSKLDEGFSSPDQVTHKELTEQELLEKSKDIEMKNDQLNNGEGDQEPLNEELDGNVLIKRKKIQFFKFWPKA